MRQHFLYLSTYTDPSSYDPTDGIWTLSPDNTAIQKLRPFFANTNDSGTTENLFRGEQGFLAIHDDRVHFQAYPYELTFDPPSWRLVNRIPAANGQATGWALQGPYLDDRLVGGTGLQPGIYGIARCILSIIINSHWHVGECMPLTVPGSTQQRTTTDEHTLLSTQQTPGVVEDAHQVASFLDQSWDESRVLLSYDPDRQGFWRGTELHAQFHPIQDGEILAPTIDLDLDSLPVRLEPENGYVSALHYHPGTGQLYGVLYRRQYSLTTRQSLFFTLDPATGAAQELAGVLDDTFPPYTFASITDPPSTYEQIMPIVADTRGAHGGQWKTDFWLYNPSTSATTVTITRLRDPASQHLIMLEPHASQHIPDALLALGGGSEGDGIEHDALFITSDYRWAAQVVAQARIWTQDPATGGSFGHAMPSVPAPYGYSNHSVSDPRGPLPDEPVFNVGANALASHLDLDHREPGRFRHNIGIVNTSDTEIAIQLAWTYQDYQPAFISAGPDIEGFRRATIVIPPHDLRIRNIEDLFPDEVSQGWVPRIAVFGAQPAIIWHSMIDNLTGDATAVPYTNFGATPAYQNTNDNLQALIDYRLALPVVAHNPGAHASDWQTDLYGYGNEHSALPRPLMAFRPTAGADCSPLPPSGEHVGFIEGVLAMPVSLWLDTLGVSPDDPRVPDYVYPFTTIFPDVVRRFSACSNADNTKGGLEILAGSWFSGFSRTYTTRPDGGTYGAMLPLYPPGGWPVQHFAGLETSTNTRINIGLFNGNHDHAITHRVTLYNATGNLAAQREITIAPLDLVQQELTQFFQQDALPPGTYGLTVLPIDDHENGVEGRSWAYVSIIDNRTNDPINLW